MKSIVRPVGVVLLLMAAGTLAGCQSTMLSDDRIVSNTAGVLGVAPDELTISNRRSDGTTNTYYVATTRSGRR